MMKDIQSVKNPWIKELKKYHKRKYREQDGKYLLEGFHLIEEAQKAEVSLEAVLFTDRGEREWQGWLGNFPTDSLYHVSEEVMKALSDLPSPQGILAVARMAETEQTDYSGGWLLLDDVQDPGNVGTMIRTADAAGLRGVIVGSGTADIYSTKVLRSMQGSNYHLPVISLDLNEAISRFQALGTPVYGTELNPKAVSYEQLDKQKNFALLMGNEGNGVNKALLEKTNKNVYIPIHGQAESLNVAIAAGILMYKLV